MTVTDSSADQTCTLNLTRPDYPDIIITEVITDGYVNCIKPGAVLVVAGICKKKQTAC